MMPVLMTPVFDGKKWRCARCGSTLATVVQRERLELKSLKTGEKRIVAALELPRGFVFPKARQMWVKPRKLLPAQRGAHTQKERTKFADFTKRQGEAAERKGDLASVLQAQERAKRNDAARQEASTPIAEEARPVLLFAEDLPAHIECADEACKKVSRLSAIRGVITRSNATPHYTAGRETC